MELHPLARQFDAVADVYERGRPEYAPAVIGALAAELGLAPGDPVLDLGAGTGKLTRALVAFGFEVTALEPQASLRGVLGSRVPGAVVLEGVAESIPFADRSLAGVTIADAFHWFDRPRALIEIARVLRPGGGLALFNTVPDWGGASWAHDLGTLVVAGRPEHPHFDGPPWQQFVHESGLYGEPWEIVVTTHPRFDPEGVLAHMASMSWIAGLPDDRRADVLARMRAVVEAGTQPELSTLHIEVGLAVRIE